MSQPPKAESKAVSEKASILNLAEATLALMNELVQVMIAEVDMIMSRKLGEHRELLQRKQRLTMDYRANIKTISAQPDMLKQLPDSLRAALKTAAQKLADVTERNAKSLRGAVTATQRLIQNIVAIVKQEVLPKSSYHNPADMNAALGGYSPTCKPVAVSRTA